MMIPFDLHKIENCSFWKCELKPSEHVCKTFFNYLKLYGISFFTKNTRFTTNTHLSNECSQHYWQVSFNIDSSASQSRFDFMPSCSDICKRYPIPKFKICVGLGVFLHIHGYCSVMSVKDTNILVSRIGARNILRGAESSDQRGRNAAGKVV